MKFIDKIEYPEKDKQFSGNKIELFKLFNCLACNKTTLVNYTALIDDRISEWGGYVELDSEGQVRETLPYKRQVLKSPKRKLHEAVPLAITEVAEQAESVLSKSPRASFVLCRSLLEEVCNDFGIPTEKEGKNNKTCFVSLNDRLKDLFEREKIDTDLIKIISGIRALGNKGAHSDHLTFSEKIIDKDAASLIKIIHYVVERLYVDKYRKKQAEQELTQLKSKMI